MSEKNFLTKTLNNTLLSRRSFLKWSAALGGTAALAGGLSYGLKAAEAAAGEQASQGKWVAAGCWHNCGGRCVNMAYVKDGLVIRQKTDDSSPDSPDFPQQRGCLRGRSQRQQVLGADRLKYPMKRAHWAPGGGDKSLRGRDDWVRISWDEALNLVATELKRIKETYGNASIMPPRYESRLLNAYGGAFTTWGVSSEGSWPLVREKMTGVDMLTGFYGGGGVQGAPDRMDYRKTKLVVLWGANPASSSPGSPAYNYLQAKKAGAKFVVVAPHYNPSAAVLADEWIPVRPGTDAALLLAIAHHMIVNNLQDQEFLDKYTIGFDRDHMPDGANPDDNFKDYVLGTFDGVAKNPEWASEICGTDPAVIRQFAQEIATTKPMVFSSSYAPGRTYRGQQYCQAFLTVGWMTGNVGVPGGAVCTAAHAQASYGGPPLVTAGSTGLKSIPNPLFKGGGLFGGYGFNHPFDTDFQGCAYEETYDAILNGEYTATVRGKIPCDIRCIWAVRGGSGSNVLNQSAGIPRGIEAFRKVDFVVTNDIVLSTVSKYADIVLPATTEWEKVGNLSTGNPEAIIYFDHVIDPRYETKDETWMEREIAKRIGLNPDDLYPLSPTQMLYNQLAGTKVIKEDASGYEPLLTITAQDIAAMGVEGKPQQGRITLADLKQKGNYHVPRSPNDSYALMTRQLTGGAFRADPGKNALKTDSGKLEIYCKSLSDTIKAFGFIDVPPIAKYQPPVEGYEDTFANWDTRTKGDYPLQLITPHYLRRSHSVFDNVRQLRHAFPEEVWINPIDAKERGIQTGDTILVSSRHGKVLRKAVVTAEYVPGVIGMGEGAWAEVDEQTGIDKAGATNTLCGLHPTGQGEEPWNTTNVQVVKWAGQSLEPDYQWPQRIPLKEA
jgi:anaerobic dimethyl sulfoxide reductase subunit A